MARTKRFIDLNTDDPLYFINPITMQIEALKIKTISGIEPEKVLFKPALKRWVRVEVFRHDAAVQSKEIEQIRTITFYLDGDRIFQLCLIKVDGFEDKILVPYCSNLKLLQEWMRKSS